MRLTESVSFWILVFNLLIGCLVGSFTHWIVGTIIFFLLAGKAAIIGLILDTISGSLKYHHDRQDIRAQKSIASLLLFKSSRSGVRPGTNVRLTKL